VIAIIGVAREEIGYLKSLTEIKSQESHAGMDYYSGIFESEEVVLVCSEMGKIPIAVAAQIAIDHYNPDMIIASGPGGPLVPYLQQGDLVVADRLIQLPSRKEVTVEFEANDLGKSAIIPAEPGLFSRLADSYETVYKGKSNRPQLVIGTVVSSDRAIPERRIIGRLQRDFGAVAIDRDGATLARVCRMNGKPFLMIKTILDTPDGELYNYFDSQLQVVPEYITALVCGFMDKSTSIPAV
jgi:adenosylhomocysteine nucleosidase